MTDSGRLNDFARVNPGRASSAILALRPIDWQHDGVVWLYMGQKTSGGYALSLAVSEAEILQGVACITVQWREPQPGAIVTQQLTSPCLVLKLPKGSYAKIAIRDADGRERVRLAVKDGK